MSKQERNVVTAGSGVFAVLGTRQVENGAEAADDGVRRGRVVALSARRRWRLPETPFPMWIFDAGTGEILAVNDAALEAYGYARDELLGRRAQDICPSRDSDGALVITSRPAGPLPWTGTLPQRRKDGTTFEAYVATLETGEGPSSARMVIASARPNAVSGPVGLKRSGLARSSASVVPPPEATPVPHSRTRTLLGRPRDAGTRLMEPALEAPPPPSSSAPLPSSRRSRLAADLQRLSSDASNFVEVDPRALVHEVREGLRARTLEKTVRIVLFCTSNSVWVRPGLFMKALHELLDNAIEASDVGAPIFVDIRDTGDGDVLCQIQDWGRGMSRDALAELGGPNPASSEKLGVTVAWTIIENHGGLLRFESAPGVGTTASIWLPGRAGP